jgi:hypothetical protein
MTAKALKKKGSETRDELEGQIQAMGKKLPGVLEGYFVVTGSILPETVIKAFCGGVYTNVATEGVAAGLDSIASSSKNGDLSDLEKMLTEQAVTLNVIFHTLAHRASRAERFPQLEIEMRMALKAQNQCRTTIDTLAQIKNPRHTIITKQANLSTGPQQVNNTLNQITNQESKISENSETEQNELLAHEEEAPFMDTRATRQAIGNDPAMETLGAVNRASNQPGKSQSIPQCRSGRLLAKAPGFGDIA